MTAAAFLVAAALGGVTRWQVSYLNRDGMPFGTLLINVAAAFVAGLLVDVSATVAVIVTTGFLGSLSTFSTVAAELVDLHREHGTVRAVIYAAVTCVLGVSAAALGLAIAD